MHFHRDVMAICDCFPRSTLKPAADDVFIGSPPIGFTFGLGGVVTFPMRVGASAVLLEAAPPDVLLQAIQEFRASVCFTSPTAYRMMLGKAGELDLSSLTKCVSAGEPLPLADLRGVAENDRASDHRRHRRDRDAAHLHLRRGRRHPAGRDRAAAPGLSRRWSWTRRCARCRPARSAGSRCAGRPAAAISPTSARRSTSGRGWNLTGDAYKVDEDGYFWFQARTDDMIISAGYNIAGPEVEEALLEHDAVAECAVVGAPDPARGQIVKAFVVPRQGVERSGALGKELQEFVKAAHRRRTSTRGRSSSWTPCRAPRPARCSASGCARWKPSAPRRRLPEPMRILQPPGWPRPRGYANGVMAEGRLVFVAGQIGWDATGTIVSDDLVDQLRQTLENTLAVLREAGAGPEHVARMTWYVTDKREYLARARELGEAYRALMGRHYPAMAVVEVKALLEDRAKVEIETTAVVPM